MASIAMLARGSVWSRSHSPMRCRSPISFSWNKRWKDKVSRSACATATARTAQPPANRPALIHRPPRPTQRVTCSIHAPEPTTPTAPTHQLMGTRYQSKCGERPAQTAVAKSGGVTINGASRRRLGVARIEIAPALAKRTHRANVLLMEARGREGQSALVNQ